MASDRESMRTVVVALLANLGIVVSKLTAAVVTGSTAMFAETVHSAADTGNSVLLLVAQRRSRRPATPGGLSRSREVYFWAPRASPCTRRHRDFLVGEEVAPAGKERVRAFIAGWPGVPSSCRSPASTWYRQGDLTRWSRCTFKLPIVGRSNEAEPE